MDRETLEARLAQLGKQRQLTTQEADRLNRALVMLEGGMAELQFWLSKEVDGYEVRDGEGGDGDGA